MRVAMCKTSHTWEMKGNVPKMSSNERNGYDGLA